MPKKKKMQKVPTRLVKDVVKAKKKKTSCITLRFPVPKAHMSFYFL